MTSTAETRTYNPWLVGGIDKDAPRLSPRDIIELTHQKMDAIYMPSGALPLEPFVLPRESYDELFAATKAVLDVLRRTLLGSAPTRQGRIEALGADPSEYPLFIEDEEIEQRYSTVMARPDVVVAPDGPKFIEFNVSGGIGGVIDTQLTVELFVEAFGGWDKAPFVSHLPLDARADMFRSVCDDLRAPYRVALLGSLEDVNGEPGSTNTALFDAEIEVLRRKGLEGAFFEPHELLEGIGYPGRSTYPVGLRHLTIPEWRELGIDLTPVQQALDSGCLLLNTQSGSLLANKKLFAWASEGRPWLTDADRALIDRYLPWTREVADVETTWRGARRNLPELLVAERERFVLKEAIGLMGLQVTLGRDTPDAQWRSAVDKAVRNRSAIAQEYIEPAHYPLSMMEGFDGTPYEVDVAPVISPYLFDGQPAGVMMRYFADGRTGVVSCDGYGAIFSVATSAR